MTAQQTFDPPRETAGIGLPWERRRLWAAPGIISVIAALLSAGISFAVLLGLTRIVPDAKSTLGLIFINAAFIVLLLGLIGREGWRILNARRRRKAASRLHVRVVTMFSLVAAVPALALAIIASITLQLGLDRWFETRTKAIVNSSISLAQAYVQENARNLQGTTLSMAFDLDQARTLYSLDRGGFLDLITQQALGRALIGAFILRQDGSVVVRANIPSDIDLPQPPSGVLDTAADGNPVLIPPRVRNLMGAVIKLRDIPDAYLYTLRLVDPEVIKSMALMEENTAEYQGLESNRTSTQLAFALVYFEVTLTILLSAIWGGIAVADRLVRPIRQLVVAADQVSAGNMDVVVPVRSSDGDIGAFADTFNHMVAEIKTQRNDLLSANAQIDGRRRFSEAVLSGVSAGVIGVDHAGRISAMNRSAGAMFKIDSAGATGERLSLNLPEVSRVFEMAKTVGRNVYRDQITMNHAGQERAFNVQITMEEAKGVDNSYVITIDDITDLVAAQRSTAWADVARRIAHEIKNPLTPIQLSAERIRRRYGKVIADDDREVFDQCTDTIIRQVGDIGRMVDEFSAYARMPKPDMQRLDLRLALTEASFLTEVARQDVKVERDLGDAALLGKFDARLISQAFGNLIKNAAEAIDGREPPGGEDGHIRVVARKHDGAITVEIQDNGKGFPRDNRNRLLEPYMTTRDKGTGLGLAIVRKIIEDHDGKLELLDAPADFHNGVGAMVRITFAAATVPPDSAAQPNTEETSDHGV
jgi:two-component system nitrogen regulation sensor histidine kinase NtrY